MSIGSKEILYLHFDFTPVQLELMMKPGLLSTLVLLNVFILPNPPPPTPRKLKAMPGPKKWITDYQRTYITPQSDYSLTLGRCSYTLSMMYYIMSMCTNCFYIILSLICCI